MKQTIRELLVTTKMAESWEGNFDKNVDGLMSLVSKVDNATHVDGCTELLDVYHSKVAGQQEQNTCKKNETKPFEFTVFRN